MIHLTTWPMILVEGGLALFCLLDALLAAESQVRWLPRFGWAVAILFFPLAGSIAWVAAGRPWQHRRLHLGVGDPAWDTEPIDGDQGQGHPAQRGPTQRGPTQRGPVDGGPGDGAPGQRGPGDGGPPRPAPRWRRPSVPSPPPTPLPTDPDLVLMAELAAIHDEHERTMARWDEALRRREADLRRREDELRRREDELRAAVTGTGGPGTSGPGTSGPGTSGPGTSGPGTGKPEEWEPGVTREDS